MKMDSHSGLRRYPVLVPAFAGMTTWIPDRVRNDMRHFHASLCPTRAWRLEVREMDQVFLKNDVIKRRMRIFSAAVSVICFCALYPKAWAEDLKPQIPILDQYITQALEGNNELKAAEDAWKAASDRARQVGVPPDPRFTYGYYIQPVETRTGPQRQRFGLSQTLPWFGKLSLKEKQALLEAEAIGARAESLRLSVIKRVKEAYYEYAYDVQAITITRQNMELLGYLLKVADSRYSAGLSPYSQTLRLQVEIAKLEDRVRSLDDLTRPLRARLNASLGLPPENPIPAPSDIPVMIADMTDEEILKGVEEANPEIRALIIQASVAGQGVKLAERNFYPDFTFGLEMIQQDNARSGDPLHNGDDPFVATVSVNIPIWFEARRAAVAEAGNKERSLKRQASGTLDRLNAAMQLALFKYRDAGRKIDLFQNTLIPKAEQSMQATLDAFQTGTQSVLDLIDAERIYLEFQLSYLRALSDQGIYMAEMESLLGREIPCKIHSIPIRPSLINLK